MKCIVPGPNVKVLGRAIHSLAKLGDDLYLEFTKKELSFRTANCSKTAYATFQFSVNFFSFFSSDLYEQEKNSLKCQISMKSSLSVFRSPNTLERTVDSLQILLNPNSDKLVFLMKYKKGFIKTYHVPVIECETLQAFYHKEKSPNRLVVQPKIVCDILSNFPNNQHEITWKVTKENLLVRNYSESETANTGIRTEIKVEKFEFDEYKIETETEITFCMKELRAVLLFSDNVILPLTVYFVTSSKPIVFSVKGDVFEADIVVSTLTGGDYVDTQSSEKNDCTVEKETSEQEEFNQIQNDEFFSNMDLDDQAMLDVVQEKVSDDNVNQSMIRSKEKLKHVFQRCFKNEKFDVRQLPGYNVVLASDSDSDSDKGN
ncbi:UNVERIFIED_CONTAM: hypothetical protein PYX00_009564 [Menopon gallinae]|uniref:Cell cycle checkpoint control protein RAD9A n=1 Tax=Menopon gallinae TaxID=328185 RepID=A0AAW2HBS3_9NEOP